MQLAARAEQVVPQTAREPLVPLVGPEETPWLIPALKRPQRAVKAELVVIVYPI